MQTLKIFSNTSYRIRYQLFNIIILACTSSYIYNSNVIAESSGNILNIWNKHLQLISTIQHYQMQGDIVYTIDSHKKNYIKFFWNKYDDNHHNIQLFNVFGLNIISISIKHGSIYIDPSSIYQKNDFIDKIRTWMIQTNFFDKQLQKWIIGLPGDNTKYCLNLSGYLSKINYYDHNKNMLIIYRRYYINNIPILPKLLEIYYNQYFIKLHINYWSIQ